jgi:AcrR family transcriptional regulator
MASKRAAKKLTPGRRALPELSERRRRELLEAAFTLLAERGLEGLRTRDIAQRAGVNIATLHYYFATKEALLAALVRHASEKFGDPASRSARPAASKKPRSRRPAEVLPAELESLRDHMEAAGRTFKTAPQLMGVMQELAVRAQRDEATRNAFRGVFADWNLGVEELVRHQVDNGELSRELNVPAAARIVTSFIMGATLQLGVEPRAFDFSKVAAELERWAKHGTCQV